MASPTLTWVRVKKAIGYFEQTLVIHCEIGDRRGEANTLGNLGSAYNDPDQTEKAIGYYEQRLLIAREIGDRHGEMTALGNLGLAYSELEEYPQAFEAFKKCLRINPQDAAACVALANVFKAREDPAQAIQCLQKALEIQPDYAEAHHNLGVCLRMQLKPREAKDHINKARQLGLDRAEVYENLASVQVDLQQIDEAIANFRHAIDRNPEDLSSHRSLNSLLFQLEREDYLGSYAQALEQRPGSMILSLAYAMSLNQGEEYEPAEKVLKQALEFTPESAELKSLLAYTYEGLSEWEQALEMHAQAISCEDAVPNHSVSYARALLARQQPEKALIYAQKGADEMPFNQRAIAYLGLCWRMLENEADAFINDYDNFIQVYDIPVSERFADAAAFNLELTRVLDTLHIGKRHPPEQTLRGGTQTHGDLLDRREPEILELKAGLSACIKDYIDRLPDNAAHPLLMRKSDRFSYSASWSVRLQASGYHTMHVHPMGWISSAYYVQVPEEVSESDEHGGGIKFGEPDIDLGWRGLAARKIQPETGRLVLFPSYMWHGTVPFESSQPRTTVAFDVIPVHDET